MNPKLSIIIPTHGNPFLAQTIHSIVTQTSKEDQVIVVGDGHQEFASWMVDSMSSWGSVRCEYHTYGPEHNFGNPQRNYGIQWAMGDYLVWMDHDDVFMPGAFEDIRETAIENPNRPLMFQMKAFWDEIIWREKKLYEGNVGGHCFVTPNVEGKIGKWSSRYQADYDFITSTVDLYGGEESIVWIPKVIANCRPDWMS